MYTVIREEDLPIGGGKTERRVIMNSGLGDGYPTEESAKEFAQGRGFTDYKIMPKKDIDLAYNNPLFRDAWRIDNTNSPGSLCVDKASAINISLSRVRLDRDSKISEIEDGKLKEATRKGEDLTTIHAEVQSLLDSTERLKALDPSGVLSITEANTILLPLETI